MRTAIRSNPGWRACCCAVLLAITTFTQWPSSTARAQTAAPVQFSASVAILPALHAARVGEVRRALWLAQQSHAADREQPAAAPRGVALEWAEVPAASSDVALSSGSLTLRAINLDRAAYVMQATVIGDAGSMTSRRRSEAATFTLPGDALQEIRVDALVPMGDEWAFSGAMAVHVRACPVGPEAARCLVAVSDAVFFHPIGVGPAMRVYGEQALATTYRSGALKAPIPAAPQGTATLRVMGGGPLSIDPATETASREER